MELLIYAGIKIQPCYFKRGPIYEIYRRQCGKKHGGRHIAEDCDVRDSSSDPGDKNWSKLVIKHDSEVVIKHEVPLLAIQSK